MPIRDATARDADACAGIYAPYVRDTAISFEVDPPGPVEMAERIAEAQQRHAWLVADTGGGDQDDRVLGYACARPFKPRAAYRWTCEVSVYLDPDARGHGTGRALYRALLDRLARQGIVVAVGVMTLPNEASAALHRSLGFTEAGVLRRVGWKHGTWWDVAWYHRELAG